MIPPALRQTDFDVITVLLGCSMPFPDQLFLNLGDGRFSNATTEFGVRGDGKALGVVVADLDLDGFVDVYVGNDVMSNFLYQNQAGERFVDRSISSGAGVSSRGSPDASMGVDVADYNLDGRPDLWAANFEWKVLRILSESGQHAVSTHQRGSRNFSNRRTVCRLGFVFSDFDLDGDEDLCVCNGNVVRYPEHSPALQRMVIMKIWMAPGSMRSLLRPVNPSWSAAKWSRTCGAGLEW